MADYSVAEARNNLSKLIERAEKGETITITRHGKPAVKLVGVEDRPVAEWRAALKRVLENPIEPIKGPIDSVAIVREMRDEGY